MWFFRILLPGGYLKDDPKLRLRIGMVTGILGIFCNLLLFGAKIFAGVVSGSISIVVDAINNLSDAASSIITAAGFKISDTPADEEHPFGHGRMEYVAGLSLSIVIVALGLNFLKSSLERMIHPEFVTMTALTYTVLLGSCVVKIGMYFFYRRVAKTIDSVTLRAAAFDSVSDVAGTLTVTAALILSKFLSVPLDGVAGALVSVFIIWGGISLIRESVDPLLGSRPNSELIDKMRAQLLTHPEIHGIHEIILHDYGPNRYFATAHVEVDNNLEATYLHDLLEALEVEVGKKLPVKLILHFDPFDQNTPESKIWRSRLEDIASAFDSRLKVHDFKLDKDDAGHPKLVFHLLTPRDFQFSETVLTQKIHHKLCYFNPEVAVEITVKPSYV